MGNLEIHTGSGENGQDTRFRDQTEKALNEWKSDNSRRSDMKSIRILAFVLVAALFVTGYAITQDNGSSCEKCPVTGKTGECTTAKECDKSVCPVTGKTAGECPAQGTACPATGKTQGDCPAVDKAVASAKSHCDSAKSCCGTCQGDMKLVKKAGECPKMTLAKSGGNQALCPVSGAKINKNVFVDYKGKRIYLGCNACPEKFNKSPDAYVKKMEQQGVVFAMAPAKAKSMEKAVIKVKGSEKAKDCCGTCESSKKAKDCCGTCESSESCSGEKKSDCGSSCESKKIDT
jgi:YHS domain-containing protein